jgi:putative FmdB family regulatory protein
MPRYDYRCSACEIEFEVARSFSDIDAPLACPRCGGPTERPFKLPTMGQFAATMKTDRRGTMALDWARPTRSHGHSHAPGTPDHSH